jgi:hypothetical protein
VAIEGPEGKVAGYYTLAAAGIPLGDMPSELAKKLPRYPTVPVARLGRLAVDQAYHGQKLARLSQEGIRRQLCAFAALHA